MAAPTVSVTQLLEMRKEFEKKFVDQDGWPDCLLARYPDRDGHIGAYLFDNVNHRFFPTSQKP